MSDEEWVRRALGSTRPDAPMPDAVAARLDARLADLERERAPLTPSDATAASSRRRPLAAVLLAAATVAAVAAIGVPVVRHLGQGPTGAGSSASSASGGAGTSSSAQSPEDAAPLTSQAQGSTREGLVGPGIVLRTQSLREDLRRQLPQIVQAAQAYALGGSEVAGACAATPAPGTQGALVQLDGQQVLAELAPVRDGRRAVRVLSCGDGSTLGGARVAAR